MAGLPKKYAKMGFKKGWAAYRKVHGKKKKRSSTKKRTYKKKSTPKKRRTYTKKKGSGHTTKNKFTPSNIAKMWAISGSAVAHGLVGSQTGDMEGNMKGAVRTYTGYDMKTNDFYWEDLARGYGGAANDLVYRKLARAAGVQPYPTSKPKNMSQFLDYVTMYGATAFHGYNNQGDSAEAHRQMYRSQYGVDLHSAGFDSWQPMAMLETKGPYLAKKIIFKALRNAGYNI